MSQPSYNDFKTDLRTYVLAGTSVSAYLGTRFYGAFFATLKDPILPLSVFWPDPGIDEVHGIVQDFNMNVGGYADTTFDDAGTAYQLVRDRIMNAMIPQINGGSILIYPRSSPVEHYDEITRIYAVFSKFRVIRLQNIG